MATDPRKALHQRAKSFETLAPSAPCLLTVVARCLHCIDGRTGSFGGNTSDDVPPHVGRGRFRTFHLRRNSRDISSALDDGKSTVFGEVPPTGPVITTPRRS
jgi:hypothetical protein